MLTDSGGLQEESTWFRTPCLTLRPNTERPVTVTQGSNRLSDVRQIRADADRVLAGERRTGQVPPMWDGHAARRVVDAIVGASESCQRHSTRTFASTMLKTIFTLDYEIHGNGDGSPVALMVEPSRRLLDMFDSFEAKVTIMAEVGEILRFKRHAIETGSDDFHGGGMEPAFRRRAVQGGRGRCNFTSTPPTTARGSSTGRSQ